MTAPVRLAGANARIGLHRETRILEHARVEFRDHLGLGEVRRPNRDRLRGPARSGVVTGIVEWIGTATARGEHQRQGEEPGQPRARAPEK